MKLMERHPIDPRYPLIPLYTGGRENCIAFLRQTAQAGYACSIEEAVSIARQSARTSAPALSVWRIFLHKRQTPRHSREFTIIPFFRSP